jgi:hypothetical protein
MFVLAVSFLAFFIFEVYCKLLEPESEGFQYQSRAGRMVLREVTPFLTGNVKRVKTAANSHIGIPGVRIPKPRQGEQVRGACPERATDLGPIQECSRLPAPASGQLLAFPRCLQQGSGEGAAS